MHPLPRHQSICPVALTLAAVDAAAAHAAAHAAAASMEASPSSPSELAQLLQLVLTLPPEAHVLVLRDLPTVELARYACVHKAFRVAWRSLRDKHPGKRYDPPSAGDIAFAHQHGRLERAGALGDVAVIRAMVTAGVDEYGTPLLEARNDHSPGRRVDQALISAACNGHVEAAELLLAAGADVHANHDWALRLASMQGHAAVVALLLQHGANVHAANGEALKLASQTGHADIVQLLIQHGATRLW